MDPGYRLMIPRRKYTGISPSMLLQNTVSLSQILSADETPVTSGKRESASTCSSIPQWDYPVSQIEVVGMSDKMMIGYDNGKEASWCNKVTEPTTRRKEHRTGLGSPAKSSSWTGRPQ